MATSVTSQPAQTVKTEPEARTAPTAQDAQPLPNGRLPGTISIKMKPVAAPARPTLQKESQPVTQQRLQAAWDEMLNQWATEYPDRYEVLKGHEVSLKEDAVFSISATHRNFTRDLRPIQTAMLEFLRKQLACAGLQCRVEVHVEEQVAKVYQPSEKYEAMLQAHPELALLRKHFTEIDY